MKKSKRSRIEKQADSHARREAEDAYMTAYRRAYEQAYKEAQIARSRPPTRNAKKSP